MEFKEKIILHNEGEYDFTSELISLALTHDFKTTMKMTIHEQPFVDYTLDEEEREIEILHLPRWRPEYAEGITYEEKMARNLKVMIARFTKKANAIREKKLFEGTQLELMMGQDPLHLVYSTLTSFGYHFYKDDFDKVPKRFWKELEKQEGYYFMDSVRSEFNEFLKILPRINRDKQKLQDQYIPLLEEALNEVLPTVDLSKNELEIIGYIAKGVNWRVQRKVTKLLESKVHQIDGKKYYLTKEEIRAKGFKNTKANSVLYVNISKLTTNQYLFFDTLCKRIEEEFKAINVDPFTFNEVGEPIGINKRYFAERMGMKESTFKHRLRRLQK